MESSLGSSIEVASKRVSFSSTLDYDLVALDHMNFATVIRGTRCIHNEDNGIVPRAVVVHITNVYSTYEGSRMSVDIMDTIGSTVPSSTNAFKAVRTNLRKVTERAAPRDPKMYRRNEVTLDTEIRIRDEILKAMPDGYLDEVSGLLLVPASVYMGDKVIIHPYSQHAQELAQRKNLIEPVMNTDSASIEITLVDNANRYGKLYGYSFGRIVEIQGVHHETLADGIYVKSKGSGQTDQKAVVFNYTIDEGMQELKLYPTSHEAESNGKPDKILELREKELQEEINARKREIDLKRAELEEKILETDKLKAKLQAQLEEKSYTVKDKTLDYEHRAAVQKVESETRKAQYEARKENADVISGALKLCGIIVGAVVSVLGLIKVFF